MVRSVMGVSLFLLIDEIINFGLALKSMLSGRVRVPKVGMEPSLNHPHAALK